MLSALIPAVRGYPAVRLAAQPVHRWHVQHGPLVLVPAPRKFPTPTTDRDRTVSRRSEPSSRATLIGEQPNPWDLLQPRDVTSRHRGAKPLRRFELLGGISLLSPEYLPTWSACRPRSQAPFCHYTHRPVTNRPEGTFRSLRYSFGGDHPSQTTRQAVSEFQTR